MTRVLTTPADLYAQFGSSCPVCGQPLGSPTVSTGARQRLQSPPCFRLEIGPPDADRNYSWRVTPIVQGATFPSASSKDPIFVPESTQYTYLLCADGHIFPHPVTHGLPAGVRADEQQRVDRWNMIAAIGAPASGKTYLLIRMLNQQLINPMGIFPQRDRRRIRRHRLNPLEQVPLALRAAEYNLTVQDNKPIEPSQTEHTKPAMILDSVLPEAREAIQIMVRRTVIDGDRRAEEWGEGSRQPLVVRTSCDDLVTWTGLADLPGEMFGADDIYEQERRPLQAYDALIWVIDPVVAADVLDPLARESLSQTRDYAEVLDGSLRPGTVFGGTHRDPSRVRSLRESDQRGLARNLTLAGNDMTRSQGRPLEMLVAVNKCDLIHAALREHRKLTELGRPGSVRRGVCAYLAWTTHRWNQGELRADPVTTEVLEYLGGARAAREEVFHQRAMQVADALLARYSDEEAFWGLVHEGNDDVVDVPAGGTMALSNRRIRVASIGEHLDRSMRKGTGDELLVRDFVMSAIGSGIAFGLGHDATIQTILENARQRIRLFLCSPLATVPVGEAEIEPSGAMLPRLKPLEPNTRFPQIDDHSAALTQLFLAALRKART
jgi:hypothetical protein